MFNRKQWKKKLEKSLPPEALAAKQEIADIRRGEIKAMQGNLSRKENNKPSYLPHQDKGNWNAFTNEPDIRMIKHENGDFYTVSKEGHQDLGRGKIKYRSGELIVWQDVEFVKKNKHRHKYNAKRYVDAKGRVFASTIEGKACEIFEMHGLNFEMQRKIRIFDKRARKKGFKELARQLGVYNCDFLEKHSLKETVLQIDFYMETDNLIVLVDTKGVETTEFRMKKKFVIGVLEDKFPNKHVFFFVPKSLKAVRECAFYLSVLSKW